MVVKIKCIPDNNSFVFDFEIDVRKDLMIESI